MPRYYFDVHEDDVILDGEGVELSDMQHAILFAHEAARDIAAETVIRGMMSP